MQPADRRGEQQHDVEHREPRLSYRGAEPEGRHCVFVINSRSKRSRERFAPASNITCTGLLPAGDKPDRNGAYS